jgi:agmatinase
MSKAVDFEYPTFAGLPIGCLDDLVPGQVAVFGASEATPYDAAVASHSAQAPGAIRAASKALAGQLQQYDFDTGRTLVSEDLPIRSVGRDLGDVKTRVRDAAGNRSSITAATAGISRRARFHSSWVETIPCPFPFLPGSKAMIP